MDKQLSLIVVLSIACAMLLAQNMALMQSVERTQEGYSQFMKREVKGKSLAEYVNAESVAVFKVKGISIACAQLRANDIQSSSSSKDRE